MKSLLKICAVFILIFAASAPLYAKDVAVVVSKHSKLTSLQSATLSKAFKSLPAKIGETEVVLVVKSTNATEAHVFASKVLGQSSEILAEAQARHSLIVVGSDSEVLRIVAATPNAIGIVDVYSISSSVSVAKVDGKLPLEPGYLLHYN